MQLEKIINGRRGLSLILVNELAVTIKPRLATDLNLKVAFIPMTALEEELATLLTEAVNVKFSFLAGAFLLVYDTAINFADEVNHIWLERWSVGKVMYIVSRYCTFIDVFFVIWYNFSATLTTDSCRSVYEVIMWTYTFGIIASELILIVRTYAMWDRSTLVLLYLSMIEMACLIYYILIMGSFSEMHVGSSRQLSRLMCFNSTSL